MTEYQDYTQPILSKVDFLNYLELAKTVFRPQWRFLIGLRNVRSTDSKALKAFKERQVFCQILAMQRVTNFRELTFWALIQTTAFYGWGVRKTAVNASSFWGMTVSNTFRDREFTKLINNIRISNSESCERKRLPFLSMITCRVRKRSGTNVITPPNS